MEYTRPISLLVFLLAACAPARPSTAPVTPPPPPAATPPVATTEPPATAPPPAAPATAVAFRTAPENWHLLDATDGVDGVGVERAYRELLAGRPPARTVVVAVIDGGVDTAHVDLRANLWRNPGETAGNGRDDDGNGYVDDVHGWNFLGGADGRSVHYDTYEVTRLHALCTGAAAARPAPTSEQCSEIARDYEEMRLESEQTLMQIRMIDQILSNSVVTLRRVLGTDSLTAEKVSALRPTSADVQQARAVYLDLAANGLTPSEIDEAEEAYRVRLEYGLNPTFDPRGIVGDDYTNLSERVYGNADVMGPDAGHGTHVAGIIGAVRGNGVGVDGVAPAVRIMALRAVPEGDEHDKDVANAIRYAADNGAHIINMSFGKGYSPDKSVVDEAVRYAESRGLLLVHAAGNDGKDVGVEASYPTPIYRDGARAANWVEVGASSWRGADSLAAPFTNYSRDRVDLFAPGVDIVSTVPGGGYKAEDGTSMAAPVVTGVAALIMAYYPDLTAPDVKRILLESATRHVNRTVLRPGSEPAATVPFGTLSATGGVVNAFEALRLAEAAARGR